MKLIYLTQIKNVQKNIIKHILVISLLVGAVSAQAQDNAGDEPKKKVSGTVIDAETGDHLIGVTVRIQGTTDGTITNINGEYTLMASPASTLQFSYIGYDMKSIEIGQQTHINIELNSESKGLDEVVVVGYGSMRKSDITGAVSSVGGETVNEVASANFMDAIQGRIAGLDVDLGSSAPGQQMDIVIRGNSSITASNSPVVVIDGMPIEGGLNEINPSDIESIEILKDASSTAIYGSRGANGVILITTKRGKAGKARVSLDSYYGITYLTKRLDLMNGEEYAAMVREAYTTADNLMPDEKLFDPIAYNNLQNGTYTDWQDLMYGLGSQQSHQVSIMGGTEKLKTSFSAGYYDETGIIDNYDFNRFNIRTNIDFQLTDWFKVGSSNMLSSSVKNTGPGGQNIFDNIIRLSPLGDVYDEDGELLFRPTTNEGQRSNPLSDIENITNEVRNNRFLTNIYADVQINSWLSYRLSTGLDYFLEDQGAFYGSESSRQQGGNNSASIVNRKKTGYMVDNILTAQKTWADKHRLNVTLMTGIQGETSTYSSISANRIPNDDFLWHNIGSAEEISSVASSYADWMLLSYMGRINYSLLNRYIFTVSTRIDGSSRFGDGNKYGVFPSAAFAWRLKEEEFLNNVNWLHDLKLRVSYGVAGNTGIPAYKSLGSLENSSYAYGDRGSSGFLFNDLANPELRWEKTASLNIGLDHSMWKGRLYGSIEYYNSLTKDLLLNRQLPASTGYTTVLQNIGEVRNSGVEFNLNTVNVKAKNFVWSSNINFAYNKNEIVNLYGDGKDDIGNQWFIGNPINVRYDFRKLGVWQLDEAEEAAARGFNPGELKVTEEREIIGQYDPKWVAGMTHAFNYKGWELSMLFTGKFGHIIYSDLHVTGGRLDGRYNNLRQDYWTLDNPTNEYPRPDSATQGPKNASTNVIYDGDFIRLKNITFAYNFSEQQLSRLPINRLRLYAQAKNPKVWTEYDGYDPEFGRKVTYPGVSSCMFGLNASF